MPLEAQPDALGELLTHKEWVANLARSLVSDRDLAEEITQEAWLAALKNPPRAETAKAWFCQVLRAQVARIQRGDSNRLQREQRVRDRGATALSEAAAERAQMLQQVVEMTLGLEEPYRETMLLRYIEELAPRDISRRLGIPVNTINSRIQRGLEKLRQRLRKEHGESRWALALMVLALRPAELRAFRLAQVLPWANGVCALTLFLGALATATWSGHTPLAVGPTQVAMLVLEPRGPLTVVLPPEELQRETLANFSEAQIQSRSIRTAESSAPPPRAGALALDATAWTLTEVATQNGSLPDLVVTSTGIGRERVVRISPDGTETVVAESGAGSYWVGNTVLPEGDWVCAAVCGEGTRSPALNVFDGESGRLRRSFGLEEVRFPGDVAVFSDGTLAVSERHEPRVELYAPTGEHRGTLKFSGRTACGLFVDESDVLWVADPIEGRVHRLDRQGRALTSTRLGYRMGDLVTTGDGTFWTLRAQEGLVERFDLAGRVLASLDTLRARADGLALDEDGTLWVSSVTDREVIHLDARGGFLGSLLLPEGVQPEFMDFAPRRASWSSFCSGQEAAQACPCGVPAADGEGCPNSAGRGVRLIPGGSTSLKRADLHFAAQGLPPGEWCLLLASAASGGREPTAFGAGLRCIGPGARRLTPRPSDDGGAARWGAHELAALGAGLGEVVAFQVLYRDALAGTCGDGLNSSNAVAVEFRP